MRLGLFPVCGLCPFLPFPQWAEIILCPFHLIYNLWSIKRPAPLSDVSPLAYRCAWRWWEHHHSIAGQMPLILCKSLGKIQSHVICWLRTQNKAIIFLLLPSLSSDFLLFDSTLCLKKFLRAGIVVWCVCKWTPISCSCWGATQGCAVGTDTHWPCSDWLHELVIWSLTSISCLQRKLNFILSSLLQLHQNPVSTTLCWKRPVTNRATWEQVPLPSAHLEQ